MRAAHGAAVSCRAQQRGVRRRQHAEAAEWCVRRRATRPVAQGGRNSGGSLLYSHGCVGSDKTAAYRSPERTRAPPVCPPLS
eukprot:5426970-Prymnesium_polylepis.1